MGEVIKRTKDGRFLGYYLRWYESGKRRQLASKQPTYAEARRMLIEIEARVARGMAGIVEPAAPSPSVGELVERFLSEYARPRIKDIAKYRALARVALQRAVPMLGEMRADALTATDVSRMRDQLSRSYAANSVRLTVAHFGTMLSWAVRLGILERNPAKGVELPMRRDEFDYLSAEEVKTLLKTAADQAAGGDIQDQLLHARVLFAVYTGVRKGELCGLRWRDLDIKSRRLTVARSYRSTPKSGKTRHLRLPDIVVPVLEAWAKLCPRTDEGYVFPSRWRTGVWGLSKNSTDMLGLPSLLTAAGLRPCSRAWHMLRHTFASHYIMSGGSLLALSKILGHGDIKMTMIYAHLAPDFIGTEMNRVRF